MCERGELLNDFNRLNEPGQGFSINFGNGEEYGGEAIEFYDISSHIIYLKEKYNFDCEDDNSFSVSVGSKPVYDGHIQMLYSSAMYPGAFITCPSLYPEKVIQINYNPEAAIDIAYNSKFSDPRENNRIIDALKGEGLYREGLSARINSVKRTGQKGLAVEFTVTNNDKVDLYFPDPDKMGTERFHYFTYGLSLVDSKFNNYNNNMKQEGEGSFCAEEWLSDLSSGESRSFRIVYPDFDELPVGSYYASFVFPGAGIPENIDDVWLNNGRIWLGNLQVNKVVQID